jgi:hypothetical protein
MILQYTCRTLIAALMLTLASCGSNNQETSNNPASGQKEETSPQKVAGLSSELLGNYHGVQPGYFMKNKYGDDMVINGNKISVPSADYKFLIKEDNTVSLQQINLEDNSRVYYEGTIKILSDNASEVKIECALSDGHTSKPTYTLTINKTNKKANCVGSSEPEFQLEKK